MSLNLQQQTAIKFIKGPCLVLAGAGSGKTRVITNKITYLIRVCGYKARHIAALTFTNKASREMKERVAKSLSSTEIEGLTIATFHTLGLEIIKKEHKALAMRANFSLFDNHDQLVLLRSLTEDYLEGDKDLINQLTSMISSWKNHLQRPSEAEANASSKRDKIFVHYYKLYDAYLKSCNILDFDDLILLPALLLRNDTAIRERWQNKLRYVLVDEYQDTNTSQYELIKLLVGKHARFTVVGDDDQSIYSWRGARPQNLVLLQQDFPSLKIIKLEQNYRSTECILNAANILISHNNHVFEKRLFSDLGYGEEIKVLTAINEEHEAELVIRELITHHFINKISYRNYAILYRSNHQARIFEKTLIQNQIPYKISKGSDFFSRQEIKDLISYLRLLINKDDDSAFLRVVNTPRREIGPITLSKLSELAIQKGKSMFAASFDIGLTQYVSGRSLDALKTFTQNIANLAHLAYLDPLAAVSKLIRSIDYETWLYKNANNLKVAEIRIKNVKQLLAWMTDMIKGNDLQDPMSLEQVITSFTLRDIIDCDDRNDELNQVQLMTLHSSKGLEFSHVFLVGMEEGILPHQNSINKNNIEEERRLAYVGITRAQKTLTLTICRERRQYGEIIRQEPSRFLLELPHKDLAWKQVNHVVTPEERIHRGRKHIANIRAQMAKALS